MLKVNDKVEVNVGNPGHPNFWIKCEVTHVEGMIARILDEECEGEVDLEVNKDTLEILDEDCEGVRIRLLN